MSWLRQVGTDADMQSRWGYGAELQSVLQYRKLHFETQGESSVTFAESGSCNGRKTEGAETGSQGRKRKRAGRHGLARTQITVSEDYPLQNGCDLLDGPLPLNRKVCTGKRLFYAALQHFSQDTPLRLTLLLLTFSTARDSIGCTCSGVGRGNTGWGSVVRDRLLPVYSECVSEMKAQDEAKGKMRVSVRHSMDTTRQCTMAQFLAAATVLVPGRLFSWYTHMRVGQGWSSASPWTCSIDRECNTASMREFAWPGELQRQEYFFSSRQSGLYREYDRHADNVLTCVKDVYSLDGVDCQPRKKAKEATTKVKADPGAAQGSSAGKIAGKHGENALCEDEIELTKPVFEYLCVLLSTNPVEWSPGEGT